MRTLGYPRPISTEHFATPNFPLVAEILHWLSQCMDSNLDISMHIDSEQDRIVFINSIAQFLSTKTFTKLNPKRLYEANGHAVKEILKFVKVLYSALKLNKVTGVVNDEDLSLSEAVKQPQLIRSLAGHLTSIVTSLKSFMSKEADFRKSRKESIERHLDVEWVEKCLNDATDITLGEVSNLEKALSDIKEDEKALDGKIEKRRHELERNQIRLSTLKSVRPTYMDEYEQLEEELKSHYETYLDHFRNISYLESLRGEISFSDDLNENTVNIISKSAAGEGVDVPLSNIDTSVNGNIFYKKNRSVSLRNFEDSKSEESNSSSDLIDPENSITNDNEALNRQDYSLSEDYDFVEGLSVVGHGYRMDGDWTPCKSGDKDEVISSIELSRDEEISRYDIDEAFAEALAETNKLVEEIVNEQKANRRLKNLDTQSVDGLTALE
nr:Clusterin associated protein 1 [Hymenolepis microstoma]